MRYLGVASALGLLLTLTTTAPAYSDNKPDIVIIVVDALRPDHLGCYGYERPTSPRIDEFAASSTLFRTAIAQAPWTKGSLSSMFTSLYSFQHGVTHWESVMPDTMVTLAEILHVAGYSTGAIMNMIGLGGRFEVLQGFDEVDEKLKHRRGAVNTTGDAVAFMTRTSRPHFLLVHYFDAHSPYRPPDGYTDLILGEHETGRAANPGGHGADANDLADDAGEDGEDKYAKILAYDACIRYVDEAIGAFLNFLTREGIMDNALIIITADHGESLGEHDLYGHGGDAYEDAIRVPLIIRFPRQHAGGNVIEAQVRHIDLFPTILGAAGLADDRHREGTSLTPLIMGKQRNQGPGKFFPLDAAFCDCTISAIQGKLALRTAAYKAIFDPLTYLAEIYDMKNDPMETLNLFDRHIPGADSLLAMTHRVPSAALPGWRIAFTGLPDTRFRAALEVPRQAAFTKVGVSTRMAKDATVTMSPDSASLAVEVITTRAQVVRGRATQVIYFDTEPPDAAVAFRIEKHRDDLPAVVSVGSIGKRESGDRFVLEPAQATGLSEDLMRGGAVDMSQASIWYMHGRRPALDRPTAEMTPEEIKRLKALGYLQ